MAAVKEKRLLFSVTRKDCDWQTFRSGGKGGQNQNKVESGVRCIHRESGARGEARDSRDQLTNRRESFRRMTETPVFQKWHKIEVARRLGKLDAIEKTVDALMAPENIKVEYVETRSD